MRPAMLPARVEGVRRSPSPPAVVSASTLYLTCERQAAVNRGMIMLLNRNVILVLWAALALGACRDATEPAPAPVGSLSFQFSGAVSGTFEAVGAEPAARRQPVTFATAQRGAQPGALIIGGFRARGEAQDVIFLELRGVTGPGVYPTSGSFHHGIVDRDFTAGRIFRIVTGEVRITSLTPERVEGTFSATAASLEVLWLSPPDTVQITDGRFDVPVTSAPS